MPTRASPLLFPGMAFGLRPAGAVLTHHPDWRPSLVHCYQPIAQVREMFWGMILSCEIMLLFYKAGGHHQERLGAHVHLGMCAKSCLWSRFIDKCSRSADFDGGFILCFGLTTVSLVLPVTKWALHPDFCFLGFLKPRQSLSPSRVHGHPLCTCFIRVFAWCLLPLPLPFTPHQMINGKAVGLTPSSVRFKSVTCFRRELVPPLCSAPFSLFLLTPRRLHPSSCPSTALFQIFFLPKELEPISHVINSSIWRLI